jgi:AraC-like DNA-binding protein/quercetin dioxygenase-like cupin family protein
MSLSGKWMTRSRINMPLVRGKGVRLTLGRYNYGKAHPALPLHDHHGALEICFLVKGVQIYQMGACRYRLRGGDVFIAYPNERHSSGGFPQEKGVLYWMILEIPVRHEGFLGLPIRESRALLKALLEIKSRHFRGSWKMKERLDAITILSGERRHSLNSLAIMVHAAAFLLEVVACAKSPSDRGPDRLLLPVLQTIEKSPGEPVSVPALAARTGLSVPRFKARFKQEIGVPPGEYVLRVRIEEARRRLMKGTGSITDIAYDLGFSSSQYFSTVFKRFTGCVPSVYRLSGNSAGEVRCHPGRPGPAGGSLRR